MRYEETYSWSIYISINSLDVIFIRVWKGDVYWEWYVRRPLKIRRLDTSYLYKSATYMGKK